MDTTTYFKDHWVEISAERLEAYEQMFEWRPHLEPMLVPAQLAPGQTVVDYGCGPGGLLVELARRVGEGGLVHGVDLNEEFLARATKRAERDGVAKQIALHHATDDRIPLPDATADRLICKNVLEYVPDLDLTLAEFHRVLKPGGLAQATDSDWGLLTVEPIGPERMGRLFEAAKPAYKTPLIGRKLFGAFRRAGFDDVKISASAPCDTKGHMAAILQNMCEYARASGGIEQGEVDALLADVRTAIADGTYLLMLPQFLVTGRRAD